MKDQYQHYLELLKGLRLMDDDFFSEALDEKIEPVEYILRTILERNDIKVQCTEAQVEYKSATKRSIKLDIRAVDTEGHVLDIEVQRADKGASVRRARFHSSVIDRTLLEKGEDFDALVDTYVIFITRNDILGFHLPIYHIDKEIIETKEAFDDGQHIIYVNASRRDSTELGHLMHDLHCKDASEMYSDILSTRVRELKESEKGVKEMCKELEEIYNEGEQSGVQKGIQKGELKKARETVFALLEMGMPVEQITKAVKIPLTTVQSWIAETKF